MTAIPERQRENLLRVELRPGCSYVFSIKRGDGPVHLSLDDGRVVTVGVEGEQRIVRVQRNLEGWIWRYEDEPVPVEWSFFRFPGASGGPLKSYVIERDGDSWVLRPFGRREALASGPDVVSVREMAWGRLLGHAPCLLSITGERPEVWHLGSITATWEQVER